MRSYFSAKLYGKSRPATNRPSQFEEHDEEDDDQDESTDDSFSSYKGSDPESDSRPSSRDFSRQAGGSVGHSLQQPVPEWARNQNSDVASPVFTGEAEPTTPNHRTIPGRNYSMPRKPVSKPAKRLLFAVFGITGTGKTSFIKTLAGEAASRLRIGHDLESCINSNFQLPRSS